MHQVVMDVVLNCNCERILVQHVESLETAWTVYVLETV